VKEDVDPRSIGRQVREERRIAEEAERLSGPGTFMEFVKAAWPQIKKEERYRHNWHIEAYAEHLEAVTSGEVKRLQVWVPPQSMKSMTVSVLWPAWEWTFKPWLRYWGASYETRLAGRLAAMSRDLMMGEWYQARWPVKFVRDAEHYFTNAIGGTRLATSPESTGTGEHGHRILIDDPINAKEADAITKNALEYVNETWYSGTVSTRGIGEDHARIIIMQRLHENDLAGYVLTLEDWTVLALPERYEPKHPYAWRGSQSRRAGESSGSDIGPGDPRTQDGQLLWPDYRPPVMSDAITKGLGSHRANAQMQQRPAAREGELLKRHLWRFYDPRLFTDPEMRDRRPRFRRIIVSVDTPLRDKESNDFVAIQAWGIIGPDRYLLDLRKERLSYPKARRAILEMCDYVRGLYPRIGHTILIENAGYGVDLIPDLKRTITGVTKVSQGSDGDKVMRAEAASSDLESGNCFLPGYRLGNDELSEPDDSRNSAQIVDFINSCALFPNAAHDDDVDAWSQCMNWARAKSSSRGRTGSPYKRRRRHARATA
jgi:predicted phage terminase large subunit-like protein